jgi:hypothetical protein
LICVGVLSGCVTPPAGGNGASRRAAPDVTAGTYDDIYDIVQFYETYPWVRDDEARITGITTRVYFPSSSQRAGVFVPGTIVATLHELRSKPDGTSERKQIYQWDFDARRAYDFRHRNPSTMGQSYLLFLRWPRELSLMGHRIQVTLSYTRKDGQVVSARGTEFRVPAPGAPPPQSTMTTTTRPAGVPNAPAAPTTQPAAPARNKRPR